MEIYDSLLGAVCDEYDRVTLIKKSERGEVTLIRHRASGNRYIFRHFSGSSELSQSAPDHGGGGKGGKNSSSGRICAR